MKDFREVMLRLAERLDKLADDSHPDVVGQQLLKRLATQAARSAIRAEASGAVSLPFRYLALPSERASNKTFWAQWQGIVDSLNLRHSDRLPGSSGVDNPGDIGPNASRLLYVIRDNDRTTTARYDMPLSLWRERARDYADACRLLADLADETSTPEEFVEKATLLGETLDTLQLSSGNLRRLLQDASELRSRIGEPNEDHLRQSQAVHGENAAVADSWPQALQGIKNAIEAWYGFNHRAIQLNGECSPRFLDDANTPQNARLRIRLIGVLLQMQRGIRHPEFHGDAALLLARRGLPTGWQELVEGLNAFHVELGPAIHRAEVARDCHDAISRQAPYAKSSDPSTTVASVPKVEDDSAYVSAWTLGKSRFKRRSDLTKFLNKNHREIRSKKPAKNRRLVHSGDWNRYWDDFDQRNFDAIDERPGQVAEYLKEASIRKAKLDVAKRAGNKDG